MDDVMRSFSKFLFFFLFGLTILLCYYVFFIHIFLVKISLSLQFDRIYSLSKISTNINKKIFKMEDKPAGKITPNNPPVDSPKKVYNPIAS